MAKRPANVGTVVINRASVQVPEQRGQKLADPMTVLRSLDPIADDKACQALFEQAMGVDPLPLHIVVILAPGDDLDLFHRGSDWLIRKGVGVTFLCEPHRILDAISSFRYPECAEA